MGKAASRKSLSRRVPSTASRRRTGPSTFTLVVIGVIVVGVLGVLAARNDDAGSPGLAPTASTVTGDTGVTTDTGVTATTAAGDTTTSTAGEGSATTASSSVASSSTSESSTTTSTAG
jgi:hypothetical protein